MSIVDFPSKWLGGGSCSASPARLLRPLCSIGLLFLLFGGSSASALDFKVDYGLDAGSASDDGVVACSTSGHCWADLKSLGVTMRVSVSASGGSIQVNGESERRSIRECCMFEESKREIQDYDRIASIDIDGAITKLPIFSQVRGTGRLEKIGVLYLRIVKSGPWPKSGNKRGPIRRGRFWSDDRSFAL